MNTARLEAFEELAVAAREFRQASLSQNGVLWQPAFDRLMAALAVLDAIEFPGAVFWPPWGDFADFKRPAYPDSTVVK